jgi:GH15 family glucan-1,4-alpha-glucosidase
VRGHALLVDVSAPTGEKFLVSYPPIENQAMIGNMRTAALVSLDGCIDWFCYPRFDSPSVFAAILGEDKGGQFRITPMTDSTCQQYYWPDTNVLITHFSSATGAGEIVDFMPMTYPRREIECPWPTAQGLTDYLG